MPRPSGIAVAPPRQSRRRLGGEVGCALWVAQQLSKALTLCRRKHLHELICRVMLHVGRLKRRRDIVLDDALARFEAPQQLERTLSLLVSDRYISCI